MKKSLLVVGVLLGALLVTACQKQEQPAADTKIEATTQEVAKEAEAAANAVTEGDKAQEGTEAKTEETKTEEAKTEEAKAEGEAKDGATAKAEEAKSGDTKADGETAEQKAGENQQY